MVCMMVGIKVKPGCETVARTLLGDLEKESSSHAGMVLFRWFQHAKEPLRFTLIEQWKDEGSVEAHIKKIGAAWNRFLPNLDGEPVAVSLNEVQ